MIDVELYGGRGGYLEHVRARTLYALGVYRNIREVDWATVARLAFVCKGNICRSPYACARARSLGIQSVSFGLDAVDGAPAEPAALRNALSRGIDLSAHRSAKLQSAPAPERDLVIVFEPQQIGGVRRRNGDGTPIRLLGIWSRPVRPYIHDPYGMSDKYFQQCFSVIDANIAALVECMARGGAPAARDRPAESSSAAHTRSCDRTLG
jgi:low molecular weight protein-tyrosine phosphatase